MGIPAPVSSSSPSLFSDIALARPQSTIFISPCLLSMIFCGFISRRIILELS